jgi:hypothetical protein
MRVPMPLTIHVVSPVPTILSVLVVAQPAAARAQQPVADTVERVDYLTFAQEAMPAGIGGAGAKLGANFEAAPIAIEGHTSSEGTETYSLQLSERRAQAVVASLVRRGLVKDRVSTIGVGESRPIAPNTDESGRSLNRRVEIRCR